MVEQSALGDLRGGGDGVEGGGAFSGVARCLRWLGVVMGTSLTV